MSNVLFFTSDYPEKSKGNLYVDLVQEFINQGHHVFVVVPCERKYGKKTTITKTQNLTVIRAKSLNFRGDVSLLEKGIATLGFYYWYPYMMNKYCKNVRFDLVLCATLPITYARVMQLVHRRDAACVYLLQKDFFPQSAVDLGILKKGTLKYRLFRNLEKKMFRNADAIGVISPKNVQYLLEHNAFLAKDKVEVCPNSIIPDTWEKILLKKSQRQVIREKYKIPLDKVVFIYGGNISRAQGIDFICDVARNAGQCENAYFLFVGNGNEYSRLADEIEKLQANNVKILSYLPKEDYDDLLAACDVGLVFLDPRFTIANIPSRTLSHMNMGQPILAATDEYTDYKELLQNNNIGLWSASKDIGSFITNLRQMIASEDMRKVMGENARTYLEKEWNAKRTYEIIIRHITQKKVSSASLKY